MKGIMPWWICSIILCISCKKNSADNAVSNYTVTTLPGKFMWPVGVAVDVNGTIYVSDNSQRIGRINTVGEITYAFSGSGEWGGSDGVASSASFHSPNGLTTDAEANIYVADIGNNSIRKVLQDGSASTISGGGNSNPGYVDGPVSNARFYWPHDVSSDGNGNLYIADMGNKKIRKINTEKIVSTIAPEFSHEVISVVSDPEGNLYASTGYSIHKISVNGQVSLLGQGGQYRAGDMVLDRNGNLFYVNSEQCSVLMLSPSGSIALIAGANSQTAGNQPAGNVDGDGFTARFNIPRGIALDIEGNIYVADWGNNCIRKIALK